MRQAYHRRMQTRATQERQRRTGDLLRSQPVLFQVVHGSRLYGLHRPDSDYDAYTVVSEARDTSETLRARKTFQQVVRLDDGTVADSMTVGLTAFLHLCAEGSPQALEAMFVPAVSSWVSTDTFAAYRAAYRVNPHAMTATYRRAITEHALRGLGHPDFTPYRKPLNLRWHAVRQALNLTTALETGRFNPVLSPAEKNTVLTVADSSTFVADLRVLTHGMVDLTDRLVLTTG